MYLSPYLQNAAFVYFQPMQIDQNKIYQTLFDSAGEGLVLVDQQGIISLVNNSLLEMFGYQTEEIIGQPIEILIPKTYRSQHVSHRNSYNESPKKRQMGRGMELTALRKNGEEFSVEISLNHIKTDEGHLVMGLVTDISIRRNIERENKNIRDSLRSLHTIISNQSLSFEDKIQQLLSLGCEKFDLSTGFLFKLKGDHFVEKASVNKNTGSLFKSSDWLQDLMHTTLDREVWHHNSSLLSTSTASDSNTSFLGIRVICDGKPFGVLGFIGDDDLWKPRSEITNELLKLLSEAVSGELYRQKTRRSLEKVNEKLDEKIKQRTAALVASEKLYQAIARNFPEGTINVLNTSLNYVFTEGKELSNKGVSSEDLIGSSYLEHIPEDLREQLKAYFSKIFSGVPLSLEIELPGRFYLLDSVPLPNATGDIDQILVVERNITLQKQTEQEMIKTLEKERELSELKTRFVSMASHEFRTPLGTILSSASLIGKYTEGDQQPKREKHINRIKTSVSNLTSILNDFLSLEKLEAGTIEINSHWFDISDACSSIAEDMQGVSKNGQIIHYTHEGEQRVYLDELLVKNTLFNLTSNAIKYSNEHQPIYIHTLCNQDEVVLSVRDEGIGIPEKDQVHLFERFFRAKNATNIQGTGLGLNIVKKYVNSMNGTVEFSSREGEGTEFIIRIPQNAEHAE